MKNVKLWAIMALVTLGLVYACSKESDEMGNPLKTLNLSVLDAKMCFEQTIRKQVLSKSTHAVAESDTVMQVTGLTPVNFKPQWEQAVTKNVVGGSSVNVPIVTAEKFYVKHKSTLAKTMLAQKMVVYRTADKSEMTVRILTLLPFSGGTAANQIQTFNMYQETSTYSGIVLYSDMDGKLTDVEEYEAGVVTRRASVEDNETIAREMLSDYNFYKRSVTSTTYSTEEGSEDEDILTCPFCRNPVPSCTCGSEEEENPGQPIYCKAWGCLLPCAHSSNAPRRYCEYCGILLNYTDGKCAHCDY